MTDYLGDDPAMDNDEYVLGSMMRLTDGTIGELVRIGSSHTDFLYLLRMVVDGCETQRKVHSEEEIDVVFQTEEIL